MNLTITPRDRVILGVFVVVLVGVMWGYVRWATAPASRGRAIQPTTSGTLERTSELTEPIASRTTTVTDVAPAPLPTEGESPATLPRRDYRFIAERNIFQPTSESTGTTEQPSPQPTTRRSTRQPSGGSLSAPPPLPPAPPPPPPSSTPTQPTQMASRPANLTATGIARIGDETYVLLENPQTRDIAFVRVGESAFGYEVTNVGENYVEVKQGDVAYRITLGEGKQERRVLASAAPGGPRLPSAGTFGGPFGSPSAQPGQQFGRGQGGQGGRGSTDWVNRVVERWNQLPEFVRDRILQRVGEIWQQMPPEQQQQIIQRFRQMGVNFNPPGR
ncbi:hypothetical protein [Fervidibacter sacchari]